MQKPAYDMLISYWSSDVCSSDLEVGSNSIAYPTRSLPARPPLLASTSNSYAQLPLRGRSYSKAALQFDGLFTTPLPRVSRSSTPELLTLIWAYSLLPLRRWLRRLIRNWSLSSWPWSLVIRLRRQRQCFDA